MDHADVNNYAICVHPFCIVQKKDNYMFLEKKFTYRTNAETCSLHSFFEIYKKCTVKKKKIYSVTFNYLNWNIFEKKSNKVFSYLVSSTFS